MTITIVILIIFIAEALLMFNVGYRNGYRKAKKRHEKGECNDTERGTLQRN